jgi:hypothetical protein
VGDPWGFSEPGAPTTTASAPTAGRAVGAPVLWLAGAAACIAAALVLGLLSRGAPLPWIAGWLAGGFAGIGMLAAFTMADARRRADPWYAARPALSGIRALLVPAAIATVALNAWRFADWVSRQ